MDKNTHFFGQSVFRTADFFLIDNNIIVRNSRKHKADYYIKRLYS